MRTSLLTYLGDSRGGDSPVDAYVRDLRAARDQGFDFAWTVQLPWEHDALITLAVALREVDGIRAGTGVQPIQTRHPMALAQAALTLSALSAGRFTLGIGLSHAAVSEGMWGIPWDHPTRRVIEYLDCLLPLLTTGEVDAVGQTATARGRIRVPDAPPPPVYLAALGPQMLRIAGRRTAGTITWMTGPRTLASYVVPTLRAAAEDAGRQAEVVAALPICVTDDPAKAREIAAKTYAIYGTLPSYRAMLDRERADSPADVTIIGDEQAVTERIEEIRAAGVAEISAHVFGASPEERDRTRAFLRPAQTSPGQDRAVR
jgi:F420-dependent oxidoreductase-like protein